MRRYTPEGLAGRLRRGVVASRPPRREKVAVVLPTVPRRQAGASRVIRDFLAQGVDLIVVYLNGHKSPGPLVPDRRVRYVHRRERVGPSVRFGAAVGDCDVVFTVDDDLAYPPDYVDVSLGHLRRLGPGHVVAYHMAEWPQPKLPYTRRTLFSCHAASSAYREFDYAGTGTAVIPVGLFRLLPCDDPAFEFSNDAWLSAKAKEQGYRLVRPPTGPNWIGTTRWGRDAEAIYKRVSWDGYRARDRALKIAEERFGWQRGPSREWRMQSGSYWEKRYAEGGTSGAGSYGPSADFKAGVLNSFVEEVGATSVLELGCGDGNQLSLARYPKYLGVDVSATAVARCRERFREDNTKDFMRLGELSDEEADLALSLDVIYHLIEDEVYQKHLSLLFESSRKAVAIYSTNRDDSRCAAHVRHREFLPAVSSRFPGWELVRQVPNPEDPRVGFFLFRRRDGLQLP